MSALLSDVIAGAVTPNVTNAATKAGNSLLKVVEMSYKFGTQNPKTNVRVLELTSSSEE